MDLVTKVVEAEIQAEGGADWLESTVLMINEFHKVFISHLGR
jgi:hypothetical protein